MQLLPLGKLNGGTNPFLISSQTGDIVPFVEDINTQDFSFSGNSFVMKRTFYCSWKQRFLFTMGFMGESIIVNKDTLFPIIRRTVSNAYASLHDYRPGAGGSRSFLYPIGIESIKGISATPKAEYVKLNNLPSDTRVQGRIDDNDLYRLAKVTFNYDATTYKILSDAQLDNSTPTYTFRSKAIPSNPGLFTTVTGGTNASSEQNRYVTKIVQPMTEVLRLPVGYYNWVEGLEKFNVVVSKPKSAADPGNSKIIASQEITYVWHQVPALTQPWETENQWLYKDRPEVGNQGLSPELIGACYTHLGSVNARWFDGYPPGTLLLMAIEARPYKWITGHRYYDYTFRMKFFNPQDDFDINEKVIVTDSAGNNIQSRLDSVPYSYVGHNYFLRFTPPIVIAGTTALRVKPYFSLITEGGKTLEQGGTPTFKYTDFEDLFIPYNRAHLVQYYKKAKLTPQWTERGT